MFRCFRDSGSGHPLIDLVGVVLAHDGIHALYAVYATITHSLTVANMLASEGVSPIEKYANTQKEHAYGYNSKAKECYFQHYLLYLHSQRYAFILRHTA